MTSKVRERLINILIMVCIAAMFLMVALHISEKYTQSYCKQGGDVQEILDRFDHMIQQNDSIMQELRENYLLNN